LRQVLVIMAVLLVVGCGARNAPNASSTSGGPIEELARTTEQLEQVRREKDFFVEVYNDFEQQTGEFGCFLNEQQSAEQAQDLYHWREQIVDTEQTLTQQHAINVYLAHRAVTQQSSADNSGPIAATDVPGLRPVADPCTAPPQERLQSSQTR